MKQDIIYLIQSTCLEIFDVEVVAELERPEEQFGDYATNVAMKLAKPLEKNPREIAQEIVAVLQESVCL